MPSWRVSKEPRREIAKDFKDLLRFFNTNAVKYLVSGGHRFGAHCEPRTAKDLDLFISSEPENARAASAALADLEVAY